MSSEFEKRFGPVPDSGIPIRQRAENEEVQNLLRKSFLEFVESIESLVPEGSQKDVGINQLQAAMQWMLSAIESELKE